VVDFWKFGELDDAWVDAFGGRADSAKDSVWKKREGGRGGRGGAQYY